MQARNFINELLPLILKLFKNNSLMFKASFDSHDFVYELKSAIIIISIWVSLFVDEFVFLLDFFNGISKFFAVITS